MLGIWQKFKNLSPPVQWLIIFIVMVLGLSFLFAPRPQPVDWSEISFHTQSSAEIYFHNVRSYYYRINEREKAPFILYRLKRGGSGTLSFMIVENRQADEAYIFADIPEDIRQLERVTIAFDNDSSWESGLGKFTNEDHFRLAARTYGHLLRDEQIYLLNLKDTVDQLFADKQQRRNALTVLEDYFKLVKKE